MHYREALTLALNLVLALTQALTLRLTQALTLTHAIPSNPEFPP